MLQKLKRWWQLRHTYVIADQRDSSITFSKRLFRLLQKQTGESSRAVVFVFRLPETGHYGFMLDPCIKGNTQLCSIQINDKYHCVGIETLCPTVARIFFDYGVNVDNAKLSVSVQKTADGQIYYRIEKPHEKFTRNNTPC